MSTTTTTTYKGSCHCGTVRFEADLDLTKGGSRCNCTICTKVNAFTSIVKPSAFRLLSDESALGKYVTGSGVVQRYFCPRCGVHCFGRGDIPELGGAYVSVSLTALDDGVDAAPLPVVFWDGRHDNWHAGARPTPWPISP